jgi:four helix bundle protein
MQDFRKLKVWEKGHALTLAVYKATARFPRDEAYGLTSQMRRSSSSIPTNIAEGCGKDTTPELRKALRTAMGSASELEYQLILAHDLGYLPTSDFDELSAATVEVKRMTAGFIGTINRRTATNH